MRCVLNECVNAKNGTVLFVRDFSNDNRPVGAIYQAGRGETVASAIKFKTSTSVATRIVRVKSGRRERSSKVTQNHTLSHWLNLIVLVPCSAQ